MPLFEAQISDGTGPVGCAMRSNHLYSNRASQYPTDVNSRGDVISFTYDTPTFGKNPAVFTIGGTIADSVCWIEITWSDLTTHKLVKESFRPKIAREVVATPPPPPPPPPPSYLRLIATYTEDGVPVANLPWRTDTESGITDSMGQVWILSLDPAHLVIDLVDIDSIVGDETVTINISNT